MYKTNITVAEYQQMENGKVTTIKLKTPMKPANDAMLFLKSGSVPKHSGSVITPVWLAYCSSLTFNARNVEGLRLDPMFPPPSGPLATAMVEVEYRVNSSPPFLVERLIERVQSSAYPRLIASLTPRSKATNVVYTVLSWTNVSDLMLPQHFQLIHYCAPDTKNGGAFVEYDGVATAVSTNVAQPSDLTIPTVTRVIEERVGYGVSSIDDAYTTTNGTIWSREKLLARDKAAGARAQVRQAEAGKRRAFIYVVFALVLISPLLIFIRRRGAIGKAPV
jgi:hypothetical protein